MKDRAGTVGTQGVAPLLVGLLKSSENSKARLHLIGHSYGGKVVLSAMCAMPLPRNVHSLTLLQPAVSHLCFAKTIGGHPIRKYLVKPEGTPVYGPRPAQPSKLDAFKPYV